MFVRVKKFSGKHTTRQYLQVVESYREEGKMRQRVLCTLGRVERLQDGGLDGLIQGLAKFSKNLTVIRAGGSQKRCGGTKSYCGESGGEDQERESEEGA